MRASFLIFFGIFLTLHLAINYYIFIRGWQGLALHPTFRPYYLGLFILLALSYVIGEYVEYKDPNPVSDVLVWIGALWFAFMVYFLFVIALLDLARLTDTLFHWYPDSWRANWETIKFTTTVILASGVGLAILLGFFNASDPRLKPLLMETTKPLPNGELKIAMLSDMHMGTLIGEKRVSRMVSLINQCDADVVLIAGDLIDGNPVPAIRRDVGDTLRKIRSRYGVFAITGNHEYIGDIKRSVEYLEAHGVKFLRDTSIDVGGVTIVGREDLTAKRALGYERKTLGALLQNVDRSHPIILLDHQPFHLEEAEQNGVDVQFSGHTHHAQMWPLSYITEAVYELSWGYKRKGKTEYYVSCGAGSWGPPVRIGNTPEVMCVTLRSTDSR